MPRRGIPRLTKRFYTGASQTLVCAHKRSALGRLQVCQIRAADADWGYRSCRNGRTIPHFNLLYACSACYNGSRAVRTLRPIVHMADPRSADTGRGT